MTTKSRPYDVQQIGSLPCTFLHMEDFLTECQTWLRGPATHHVVTLNPEMVLLAETDLAFRAAARQADLLVPDGAGIVWARWYLRSSEWFLWTSLLAFLRQPVERIQGVDAVETLAALCAQEHRLLYLLGGKPAALRTTVSYLQQRYPDLHIAVAPDHTFNPTGPDAILRDIQARQPGVLLVAYGAPKQTLWIEQNKTALPGGMVALGVGGAFDIIAEHLPRAPRWMRNNNLEWLWRLYLEPRRLPRIWRAVVKFPLLISAYKRRSG